MAIPPFFFYYSGYFPSLSMDSAQHAPAVGSEGVLQFKFPVPIVDPGPAQKDTRLNTHMLNFPDADHLLNVDPQHLPLLILQLKPKGPDTPVRIAHRYHINGTAARHRLHPLSYVCFIIAHLFGNIK
jgi:hypothetical protein